MRIIFSGGGTLGSVSPLLAAYEEIKKRRPDASFLWVGTRLGPERQLITSYGLSFIAIFSGKFRRYFSLKNFFEPFLVFLGFLQSFVIVARFKPDVVVSAGGFVSVPLVWAAWLARRRVVIHQQDVVAGLANKLMAPCADAISVTFEATHSYFSKEKAVLIGNPVRQVLMSGTRARALELFKFDRALPTVLVMGGGTGARALNEVVLESLPRLLTFCQIIHITGGKLDRQAMHPLYRAFDFLTDNLAQAYAAADLVVTRGGMSALSEIAVLGKPSIIIPLPGTHQEANANEFFKRNAAAILRQKNLAADTFTQAVKTLLDDPVERQTYSRNVRQMISAGGAELLADLILVHT